MANKRRKNRRRKRELTSWTSRYIFTPTLVVEFEQHSLGDKKCTCSKNRKDYLHIFCMEAKIGKISKSSGILIQLQPKLYVNLLKDTMSLIIALKSVNLSDHY